MSLNLRMPAFIVTLIVVTSLTGSSQEIDSISIARNRLIAHADSLMASYQFSAALNALPAGDSSDIGILLRIGQCNFRLGASSGAIEPYQRVLRIDSSNITALNQLGMLYSRDGDYAAAFSSFVSLSQLDPRNAYYWKQAGSMATKLEDLDGAASMFREALKLNPADMEAYVALGNILMGMEQYKSVDSLALLAFAMEPKFKPMKILRARSAFEQRDYRSAVITVNDILQTSDTTVLYARMLGVCYFNLGEHDKVPACMFFLLKNRLEDDWIYYYMGVAERELGNAEGAVAWFKMATTKSISENTSIYLTQLGLTYEQTGEHQHAIKAYRDAYNYSHDGILLYHLARNYDVYYKTKSPALTHYRKYLASDDTTRLAREYARRRLQAMGDF